MIARSAAKVETAPAPKPQRRVLRPVRYASAWACSEPPQPPSSPRDSRPLIWANVRPRSTRLVFARSRACLALVG